MTDTNIYKPLNFKLAVNLANPRSWVASALPAILGILFCRIQGYPLKIWMYLPLFLACILLQSAVNTLNDYMDFMKGTDDAEDNLEESDAVLIYGGISPKSALVLGIAFLAAGIGLGLLSSMDHILYPISIGLVGVIVVAFYSCGPLPISYLPIGELVSGIVMGGLIPLGICACSDGRLHGNVLIASIPMILGIAMIMLCNNSCDIEKDTEAGRKTLPIITGRENALKIYHLVIILWILSLIALPIVFLGLPGIINTALFAFFARKPFAGLWNLRLEPVTRIRQMKTIAAANLMGNGMYCLTFFLVCMMEIFYA